MSKVLVLKAAPALALAAPAATGGAMTTTGAATGGAMTAGRAAQLGAGATAGSKATSGLIGILNKPKEMASSALSRTMAETPFGDEQQMAQKEAENRAAYQRLVGETRQLMREGANINTTQFS